MKPYLKAHPRRLYIIVLSLACLVGGPLAWGQQTTITPNYKEADIRQIIEAVGEVTQKNFIIQSDHAVIDPDDARGLL